MIPNIRTNHCLNCETQANTIEELRSANERWAIAFNQAEERAIDAVKTLQADKAKLREGLNAIIDRGPERDSKWAGMSAKDIALVTLQETER